MSRQRYNLSREFIALRTTYIALRENPETTPVDVQHAFKLTDRQMDGITPPEDSDFWFMHDAWYIAYKRLPHGARRKARRNRKHAR